MQVSKALELNRNYFQWQALSEGGVYRREIALRLRLGFSFNLKVIFVRGLRLMGSGSNRNACWEVAFFFQRFLQPPEVFHLNSIPGIAGVNAVVAE